MTYPTLLIAETSSVLIAFWVIGGGFGIIALVILITMTVNSVKEETKKAAMSPDERTEYEAEQKVLVAEYSRTQEWGELKEKMICPHCQTKGKIRTKQVEVKHGISGAKATGAILTGGVSILATGLSQKDSGTQAHCEECTATWNF